MELAAAGDPVALTAATVLEITYGLATAGSGSPQTAAALDWFTRLATSDLVATLELDGAPAVVAGRVRAAQPASPTNGRRQGSKAERRAGWVVDIQIAACAWAHGHAIATHNQRDFAVIRDIIAELYPTVTALEVREAPPI